MTFSEDQIKTLAPTPAAYNAGKKLSAPGNWTLAQKSERALWGEIKGSGKNPYRVQVDLNAIAYKCTCPSRQFPCKHSIAIMLLFANAPNTVKEAGEEPEWVATWMDKRAKRDEAAKNQEVKKERSPDDEEKLKESRQKTQLRRIADVYGGIEELELWLKDLVRTGFLELPTKPAQEFSKVASRMVDAKAPALASWVKSLGKLDYSDKNAWQDDALRITANLYLLIRAFKNLDQQPPDWQTTLKNLVGWNQSTKELLNAPGTETIKDHWVVAGQETETIDDITVQRNWLLGTQSDRKALVLNFATKFSTFESVILPGTIIDAILAFFPSVTPNRAVVKMQRETLEHLPTMPQMFGSWHEILAYRTRQLSKNPWSNDWIACIDKGFIVKGENGWLLCDPHKNALPLVKNFDIEKILKWKLLSGNSPTDMAFVLRGTEVLPLGIFMNNQYELL